MAQGPQDSGKGTFHTGAAPSPGIWSSSTQSQLPALPHLAASLCEETIDEIQIKQNLLVLFH